MAYYDVNKSWQVVRSGQKSLGVMVSLIGMYSDGLGGGISDEAKHRQTPEMGRGRRRTRCLEFCLECLVIGASGVSRGDSEMPGE